MATSPFARLQAYGAMPRPYDENNLPLTPPSPGNMTPLSPLPKPNAPSMLGQILGGVANSNIGAPAAPAPVTPPGMPMSPQNTQMYVPPMPQQQSLLSRFTRGR